MNTIPNCSLALEKADLLRILMGAQFNRAIKYHLCQFFTPGSICQFMASLFKNLSGNVKLLEPGCGVGSLFSAFTDEAISRKQLSSLNITAYEIDISMRPFLAQTIDECITVSTQNNIPFAHRIIYEDFITAVHSQSFTHVIMNPPYKKMRSNSVHRKALSMAGIEVVNLYAGFMALAIKQLEPGGEIVTIIPRSFCNGAYYRSFRKWLLDNLTIENIHIFDSRNNAFADDHVLQENVIIHCKKGGKQQNVLITSSPQSHFYKDKETNEITVDGMTVCTVTFDKIVIPNDPHHFIHIPSSENLQHIVRRLSCFNSSLDDIGVKVSTGPIVAFRCKNDLKLVLEENTAPLLYPFHLNGGVVWPKNAKKPNAIKITDYSRKYLWQNSGYYVLTRRFSTKEEKKRLVANYYDSSIPGKLIGFDNKLNVFHINRKGMSMNLAKGLCAYLNCSLLDQYYRQFSGHTQVNATDLRFLRYPSKECLELIGKKITIQNPSQEEIDEIINEQIASMFTRTKNNDPLEAQSKIKQALKIITLLGLPSTQQNERSALTLLALLQLHPHSTWKEIKRPLMGVTPIMNWCRDLYGKEYAPNTREAFRRQTLHQFVDAGMVLYNPDKPERAVNSSKACYQITEELHTLLLLYGTSSWEIEVKKYLQQQTTLKERYARKRKMNMIPLKISDSTEIKLTPGNHSQLIKDIIITFGPRFAPGSEIIYIGDTGDKEAFFSKKRLAEFGVTIDPHGKMPDVMLYSPQKDWLLLIEAVSSHGLVDGKRHDELTRLFAKATPGLVFVTAFPNRKLMAKYLSLISWGTEVWCADAPTHMIHFNGDKFLGTRK